MAKIHQQTLAIICETIWTLEETSGLDRVVNKEAYEATLRTQLTQRGFEFTEIDLDSLFPDYTEHQKALQNYGKIKEAITASMQGLIEQHKQTVQTIEGAKMEQQAVSGAQQLAAQLLKVLQECEAPVRELNLAVGTPVQ